MRTVNVPSPLSYAPRPSGMPAIRYVSKAVFFFFTASPTLSIDVNSTPSTTGTMYGDCELLGPVVGAGATTTDRTNAAMTVRTTGHLLNGFSIPVLGRRAGSRRCV